MYQSTFQRHSGLWLSVLFILWLFLPLLSACVGPYPISPWETLKISAQILHIFPVSSLENANSLLIISQFRLPRAFLALLCGGALAVSGVILQAVLRNPLADPFTLGLSAGAACGASLVISFASAFSFLSISLNALTTFAAFVGALIALCGSLALGWSRGYYQKENIILAGIAIGAFLGAIVTLLKALNEESVTSIVFWLMGSLQGRSWEALPLLLWVLLPALLLLFLSWRKLDILSLGDEQANSLGLSPASSRFLLLCCASCLTAACVAVCGIIAFVGLVAPHILRLLLGPANGPLLLASFFGGGIFLLLADCIARTVLDGGQELPVGVVTALTGGPFFAFLIWRRG